MSALTFRLREAPPERLDLSGLVPHRIGALSLSDIERLPIGTSRIGVAVADIFTVSEGERGEIRFQGGSSRFDLLGAGLESGQLTVEGDVGQRLGQAMRGGSIEITGNAGPFAASAATGGLVRIAGHADERAGGATHGAMHGLDGATLVIEGDAGDRLGERMRRGLILVGGRAGDYVGSSLIAGTIIAPAVGDNPGYGMRRGTIIAAEHGVLLPSLVPTGRHRLVVAQLLRRAVARIRPQSAELVTERAERRAGDLATLGKGEFLMPAS
ncbi:formylmethanofuran dehydrogenase subunit C [Labrys sp. LIt4]|uniref:formylmethanofuran dehydrogenase subunit C n=1 Tax=Labrys sp. LIt4 TaxID=2821355 RepID=UPI001AE0A2E6|nr:formylmethanofuran dehydrogenase subunit C [Labrys sp. LIt4]MBP0580593.1 formylmethanofuran dehydrogenase subunit C [Labrys sp. LIt4]